MENAFKRGAQLTDGLREMQKTYEPIGDVRGLGLMVGLELVRDRETKEQAGDWRDKVIEAAFRKGLLLLGCGQNVIRLCPALTVSPEEVSVCLEILEEVFRENFERA